MAGARSGLRTLAGSFGAPIAFSKTLQPPTSCGIRAHSLGPHAVGHAAIVKALNLSENAVGEMSGGSDGTRTRGLRRDRPAL